MSVVDSSKHERFLRFFAGNEPAVRAFVRSLVPTRDDAREVMQDVALVLWRKFEEFPSDEEFRRWAFGVAKFTVLAWRRDKGRDRLVLGEEITEMLAARAIEMDDRLERQREALEECLQKLPAQQSELVRAAYALGARMDALAAAQGRTAMSLYKALHRIRLLLSSCTERVLREGGAA